MKIDVTFDFRSDTPPGKDPDAFSRRLRQYHKLLWNKSLPSGGMFALDDSDSAVYLHHRSDKGEFSLASDTVTPSFADETRIAHIIDAIPEAEMNLFYAIGYTIGDMMIFPRNRIGNKMTINGARGFHPRIKDRFDLTLECIRRHYDEEGSPLSATLARYADFFALFCDFQGYVEFFLLQDLVSKDCSTVKFLAPFADFNESPVPGTMETYLAYKERAINFIKARNRRISKVQMRADD